MSKFYKLLESFTTERYYHVTLLENLPSIQTKGLIPTIGKHSKELGETTPAVYLFNSLDHVENALLNWLGELYDEEDELVILEVELPEGVTPDVEVYEHRVYETIPPESITRVIPEYEL